MSTYEPIKTAEIVTPERTYAVHFHTTSYSVQGFAITDGRGRRHTVHGCSTERAAFTLAKRLARTAGRDVTGWTLRLLSLVPGT